MVTLLKSTRPEVFYKKGDLKYFAKFIGKHLCRSLFLHKVSDLRPVNFIKPETPIQLFSCEFCEIFKNTFLTELLRTSFSKAHFDNNSLEGMTNLDISSTKEVQI